MKYIEEMNKRIEYLHAFVRLAASEISSSPKGQLHCKVINGKARFYCRMSNKDTNGIYLSSKGDQSVLLRKLAQKLYAERILKAAENELAVVDKCKNLLDKQLTSETIEQVFEGLEPDLQNMTMPFVETDEAFVQNWLNNLFENTAFREDEKKFTTARGEKVRSKAELMIADILYREKVPYKYECPLRIGSRQLHPDFTILDVKNRKEYYWEHFGMVDDPGYAAGAIRRIACYSAVCANIGGDLIVSFESSDVPFDSVNVVSILRANKLLAA